MSKETVNANVVEELNLDSFLDDFEQKGAALSSPAVHQSNSIFLPIMDTIR